MLTLDQNRLEEVVEKAAEFENNPDVESDIAELVEAYNTINAAYSQLKATFKDTEFDFIESDKIKVNRYESGAKFKLVSPEDAPPEVLEVKLNPKAVAAYVENNNKLPEGVEQATRSITVRVSLK